MNWLQGEIVQKLTRGLAISFACLGLGVFLTFADTGYQTWLQQLPENGFGLNEVISGLVLLVFLPGIAPLLASFYFFVYLKGPLFTLTGVFAMIAVTFAHIVIVIFASHSEALVAFGLSLTELLVILFLLAAFQKYVVLDDNIS